MVGYPAADAPAWGWVQSLAVDGGDLTAMPRQVDPAFAEAVAAGRYKKVSASFYQPDSPHNPVPGVYYLRHVGFLGAQPPAVKGLAPVQFADDGDCVSFEFAEEDVSGILRRMAGLFRGLRDYFVDKEGLDKADAIIPSWTMDWLQEDAAVAAAKPPISRHFRRQTWMGRQETRHTAARAVWHDGRPARCGTGAAGRQLCESSPCGRSGSKAPGRRSPLLPAWLWASVGFWRPAFHADTAVSF